MALRVALIGCGKIADRHSELLGHRHIPDSFIRHLGEA